MRHISSHQSTVMKIKWNATSKTTSMSKPSTMFILIPFCELYSPILYCVSPCFLLPTSSMIPSQTTLLLAPFSEYLWQPVWIPHFGLSLLKGSSTPKTFNGLTTVNLWESFHCSGATWVKMRFFRKWVFHLKEIGCYFFLLLIVVDI